MAPPAALAFLALLAIPALAGCVAVPPGSAPEQAWDARAPPPPPLPGLAPLPGARATFDTSAGTFVAELASEQAPRTVDNFVALAQRGFFDGTRFHRIVRGVDIQGGDPNSRSDNRSSWGYGGPGYAIPDELHPALRHDDAGVLSMATSGPGTGGSQFFVTLAAVPSYDDRYSVFGRVVQGLDVVRAIGDAPIEGNGTYGAPLAPVVVRHVTIAGPDGGQAQRAVQVVAIPAAIAAAPAAPNGFAAVVRNTGNARDNVSWSVQAPAGWTARLDLAQAALGAGMGIAVVGSLDLPAGARDGDLVLRAASASDPRANATAVVHVRVAAAGALPGAGARVRADMAALLADGRWFATTWPAVADDARLVRLASAPRTAAPPGPLDATLGQGVAGFDALLARAPAGITVAARVPAAQAYASPGFPNDPLGGRDVVFVAQVEG